MGWGQCMCVCVLTECKQSLPEFPYIFCIQHPACTVYWKDLYLQNPGGTVCQQKVTPTINASHISKVMTNKQEASHQQPTGT